MTAARFRRWALIAAPYAWLVFFFLLPFLIVLRISLSDTVFAQPPYSPTFDASDGVVAGALAVVEGLDADNYEWIASDRLYTSSFVNSLTIASVATVLTLLVGYPLALAMARAPRAWRPTLLTLVILPFWTSFLIRVYALEGFIGLNGPFNQALLGLGVIAEPLRMVDTTGAVIVGIVYSYLPFMVLPLYAALERMDESLIEAAQDLGASPTTAFWLVTFPLSLPGVIAGSMLVFIPAVGEFVIPELLGDGSTQTIARTIWREFFSNRDWPVASAIAMAMLAVLVIPIVVFQRQQFEARTRGGGP